MSRDEKNLWFHGKITREHAEELVTQDGNEDGTFLIRESNTATGDFVLTLLYEGNVIHYQIRRHGEDAFFSIDDKVKTLHGLDTLVEFYQQAANGLVTKLQKYIKKNPPPNDVRNHGVTNLLHRATKENNHTVVSELLKCGYRNVDAKNQDGQTAMHLAALHCDESILRLLLDAGVSVNCMDSAGNTPLHYACRSKSASFVRILITERANVQARNMQTGYVPLHDAAKHGNLNAVKELLNAHAPYLPRTSYGEFPSDLAKEQGHEHVTTFLSNYILPMPTTHETQWYHGTLKREEASQMLKEYAKNLAEQQKQSALTMDEKPQEISGCFLVRSSERKNASFVLTLLWNDNIKNFIISKDKNYLYIDDGPYHPSLEHLVEHFMRFPDGLPCNLKYPLAPKPKPPLPLFRTMPKNFTRSKSTHDKSTKTEITAQQEKAKMPVQHAQTLNPKRHKGIFHTLRLRSPKKENAMNNNIVKAEEKLLQAENVEKAQKLLTNITFSTEFSATHKEPKKVVPLDGFYNVPTNNAAISDSAKSNLTVNQKSEAEVEYFTKSDLAIEYVEGDNLQETNKYRHSLESAFYISPKELCAYMSNSPLLKAGAEGAAIISDEMNNEAEALKIKQAKQYIIPRQCLELTAIIGEGEFGSVYRGVYKRGKQGISEGQPVAIKTLLDEQCLDNKEAFLREAAVMMQLRHHCIVQLIGISRDKTLMMVQELIPYGSMLDFIHNNRSENNLQNELKLWSAQIACGMQYLEACHFVHRDLAARNILLASRHQAKISDFGLSRAMGTGSDFYQASQGGKWPIKWYAPESFNNGIFSHASDVWSFGVTLWEMFSLGEQPYGELRGAEAIELIEKGSRLPQPPFCPDHIYELMQSCWLYNAKDRPTFHYLMEFFARDPVYQNIIELVRTEHIS